MDVIIVDDELLARERLARMLARLPEYRVVAVAEDAQSGLIAVEKHDPDIVLCDIRMPGMDGLKLAENLQTMDDPPALIFCTAYDQYALEAFGVQAVDYLLKPVSEEDLRASLVKASRLNRVQRSVMAQAEDRADERAHIQASSRRGVTLIPLLNVHYCRAEQKYVSVFHGEGESLIDDTLKELEEAHPQYFLRVHRNTLVAVNRIVAMMRTPEGVFHLQLRDCVTPVVVSRRHVAAVKALLATL